MKAIHGGKAKNDKIDAFKIATLLRGGSLPQAYVYPRRDEGHSRSAAPTTPPGAPARQLLAHIQNTHHQYNLPPSLSAIAYKANRDGVAEVFDEPERRKSMEVDFTLIDHYDELIRDLELHLVRQSQAARSRHLSPSADRSPASARSWRSRSSTRSTTSVASRGSRTSSPTPGS